jgi:hypothetical protein
MMHLAAHGFDYLSDLKVKLAGTLDLGFRLTVI